MTLLKKIDLEEEKSIHSSPKQGGKSKFNAAVDDRSNSKLEGSCLEGGFRC